MHTTNYKIGLVLGLSLSMSLASADSVDGADNSGANEDILELESLGPSLTETELAGHSGQQGNAIENVRLQLSNSDQEASVGDNVLNSLSTGTNTVAGNAFADSNGFGSTIIQNSGNQVVIQNSTILNLSVE